MLNSLSEQPFDFTMHYNGHRESTYIILKRSSGYKKHLCNMPFLHKAPPSSGGIWTIGSEMARCK